MKTKALQVYHDTPKEGVDNLYPTSKDSFKQPCLHMIVGQRTSGKSYLCSKILAQCARDQCFDIVYMITPSFNSNQAYFGKYVKEENVYQPTKESIQHVIQRVEADRDEWERYLAEKEEYQKFKQTISQNVFVPDQTLLYWMDRGFLNRSNKEPKWKYKREEPPKSCLILDDCLSSPAILQSSGLTQCATLNRHIAPLQHAHSGRSACGLAVMILSQTYRMQNGLGRCLRENLSLLTLFSNKQQKQLECIKDELANVVDEDKFMQAFRYATKEKYGNLTIDFIPKDSQKVFRKNLNECIIFD